MSAVYNTEPPTNGKVVLKTTLGDVDLELWPKEAPKVCMAVCPPPPRPHSLRHRSASLTHLASPPPRLGGAGCQELYSAVHGGLFQRLHLLQAREGLVRADWRPDEHRGWCVLPRCRPAPDRSECIPTIYEVAASTDAGSSGLVAAVMVVGRVAGGQSIYGGIPFADEFHSRLRFTHRCRDCWCWCCFKARPLRCVRAYIPKCHRRPSPPSLCVR
jgi:hypothetical protein